jgi:sec-independent protein translocase protein TatA
LIAMTVPILAMLQMPEIIGLLILALILFGAKKLPELARGLGSGIKEFKKATRDVTDELQSAMDFDRPSSSSRSSQYPAHTDPMSSESDPGYGTSETPEPTNTEADPYGSPSTDPEPKEDPDATMNSTQSEPDGSAELNEAPAATRAGKSE